MIELKELIIHDNPIVRSYAFKALTMVSEADAFSIVTEHLQDTTEISTHHGCFGSDEFVGDFFVNVYRSHEAISHDSSHLKILDSLLIFERNKLEARNAAVRRAAKHGKYYERIREIAITDRLAGAVLALATFKQEQDVNIIINTKVTGRIYENHPLGTTFFAISEFPHPSFLPFLKNHLDRVVLNAPNVECRFLYLAISSYNNKDSHDLLLSPFQIADSQIRLKHLEELSRVLQRNTHPIYNDIRTKLKQEVNN